MAEDPRPQGTQTAPHRNAEGRVDLHLLGSLGWHDGDQRDVPEGVLLDHVVHGRHAALRADGSFDLLGQFLPGEAHHLEAAGGLVEA